VLAQAEAAGEVNRNCRRRLEALRALLRQCEADGVVACQAAAIPDGCLLGWSRLQVHDPVALRTRVLAMIERDEGDVWRGANGKQRVTLRNPTWIVYELFRKIGCKPCGRAAPETDPGPLDKLHYRAFEFRNDAAFMRARKRMEAGYSYCPEKGQRERKRVKRARGAEA
jgi:hypothetical protein